MLAGFAGASADAFTLLDRFERKLEAHRHNLARAAVELAKDWRTDRFLRRLEAMLIVADASSTLAAQRHRRRDRARRGRDRDRLGRQLRARRRARAAAPHRAAGARTIARESMRIAAEICVYTNVQIMVEELAAS